MALNNALTADAVKETIIRYTIKRQPMKKISAEVGISESTIGRIVYYSEFELGR